MSQSVIAWAGFRALFLSSPIRVAVIRGRPIHAIGWALFRPIDWICLILGQFAPTSVPDVHRGDPCKRWFALRRLPSIAIAIAIDFAFTSTSTITLAFTPTTNPHHKPHHSAPYPHLSRPPDFLTKTYR